MKRIIDISEDTYNMIKDYINWDSSQVVINDIEKAIRNSTPFNECKAENCISREQALKNIVAWSDEEIIRNLPSVTPKSDKPSGEWDMFDEEANAYCCSICNTVFCLENGTPKDNEYNYCPNCGADLRGKTE